MRAFVGGNGGGPAFLQSLRGAPGQKQGYVGELFTFTLANGTTYRWTSYPFSLSVGANTWLAQRDGAPLVTRNRFGVKNTVEVPEMELRLGASDALLSNLKQQIHNGLWDGARVEMDRVFMPGLTDTQYGYVVVFGGRQSGAVIDAEGVTLSAKGDNVLMNQQAPRNLYQTNCRHTFCDANCTLIASNYTLTGQSVLSGSTSSKIVWTVPGGFTASQFTNGKITMTSGAANGQVRTVRLAGGVTMLLTYPLYNAPSPGDMFSILMGCGKEQSDCQSRVQSNGTPVNNIQHFGGEPYVPVAEIAV